MRRHVRAGASQQSWVTRECRHSRAIAHQSPPASLWCRRRADEAAAALIAELSEEPPLASGSSKAAGASGGRCVDPATWETLSCSGMYCDWN